MLVTCVSPHRVKEAPSELHEFWHNSQQLVKPEAQPQVADCPAAPGLVTVIVPAYAALVQPPSFFTVTVKAVFAFNVWVVFVFMLVVLDVLPIFHV